MRALLSLFGDEAEILRDTDLQLLIVANTMGLMGLSMLSPVLSSLTGPFDAMASEVGLLMAAYTAPAIVLIPIIGVLADRFGRKPVILAGLGLLSTAGTLIALTTDFRLVIVLRFIQGIGGSAVTPIIITAIGDLYAGTRETAAQGFRFTGSGLSQLAFPLLAGILVGFGWRYPFYLHVIGFPIILLVYLRFEETLSDRSPTPRAGLGEGRTSRRLRQLVGLLTAPGVGCIVVARSLGAVVWIAFLTYNSIIVVQLIGGSPIQAGLLAAIASLITAITASQVGRLPIGGRKSLRVVAGGQLVSGAGFIVLLLSPGFPLALVSTAGIGLGQGIVGSVFRSVITSIPPESIRGTFVSLNEAAGRLMVTLTPILMSGYIAAVQREFAFEFAVRSAGILAIILASGTNVVLLMYVSYRGGLPGAARDDRHPTVE